MLTRHASDPAGRRVPPALLRFRPPPPSTFIGQTSNQIRLSANICFSADAVRDSESHPEEVPAGLRRRDAGGSMRFFEERRDVTVLGGKNC